MFGVHFHWFPTDLVERARETFPQHVMLRPPYEKIEDSLRVMDENGVEMSLISYGAFREPLIKAHPSSRADACRALNEKGAELRARYPGRFLIVAAVDELSGEAAVPELEKAVKDPVQTVAAQHKLQGAGFLPYASSGCIALASWRGTRP